MSHIIVEQNPEQILSSNQIHNLHHTFYTPVDSQVVDESTGQPKNIIKATFLIVHGMSEHSARYDAFARFLAENGVAVLTYDQLGHGKTVNRVDELGYFNDEHPMQMVLKDVVNMSNILCSKYAHGSSDEIDIPHFIMGHSMGSFIVRNILTHHSSLFDGAILMGTSDKDPLVSILLPLVSFLNKKAPKIRPQWLTDTTAKVLNAKLNKKDKLSAEDKKSFFTSLSKNPANREAYEADPLCGFAFTHNGYFTLFSLMNLAVNKSWYKPLTKNYPLLVISGENDPIGNMGKGIDKLVERLKSAGHRNVSKKLYPDLRHEPLNEENPQTVYEDVLNWIVGNLAK